MVIYFLCEAYIVERFPEDLTLLLKFSEPVNIYGPLIFFIPFSILTGILCKNVEIEDNKVVVKYMFGILSYTFDHIDLQVDYNNKKLYNPAGPVYSVSNEHIKLNNKKQKTIIYSCGTSNFEKLLKVLERIIREQENRTNLNHYVVE